MSANIHSVWFLHKVNAGPRTAIQKEHTAIIKGNPSKLEAFAVQGGVDVKWKEGLKACRVFVPLSNVASIRFEDEDAPEEKPQGAKK